MGTVSILLYVREQLDEAARHLIDTHLRALPGVVAPWFSPWQQQSIMIYYNPEKTTVLTLVHSLRRYGYNALIVGL